MEKFPLIGKKEEQERLLNQLKKFRDDFYDEPGEFLTREERSQLRESKNPEDQKRFDRYEKSKFRVAHFHRVFLALSMVLNEGASPVRNREALIKEKAELFNDVKRLETEKSKPIPKEIVERLNNLLKKVIESAEK